MYIFVGHCRPHVLHMRDTLDDAQNGFTKGRNIQYHILIYTKADYAEVTAGEKKSISNFHRFRESC